MPLRLVKHHSLNQLLNGSRCILPPIRVLAQQLLVNPNTVARAYRELEVGGVVIKRRTAGTFVSDEGSPLGRRERLRVLSQRVDAFLAEARQMNVSTEDPWKLLRRREGRMISRSSEG